MDRVNTQLQIACIGYAWRDNVQNEIVYHSLFIPLPRRARASERASAPGTKQLTLRAYVSTTIAVSDPAPPAPAPAASFVAFVVNSLNNLPAVLVSSNRGGVTEWGGEGWGGELAR